MNDSPLAETTGRRRTLVRAERVEKTFSSGVQALAALDLEIGEHEFLALLGPSGCGKSTALRLFAGLGDVSGGRLSWADGLDPRRQRHQRAIGFVFQEPTLMPWATAFDNVFLPLRLDGVGRGAGRARVEEALTRVGLEGFEGAYPRELSGGMKMRVSIARALVTGPRLLLMDEPFAALDEITRFRLNDDLLELWRQNSWTVVFVTHSVYESVYLASRIAVMATRPGRIIGEIEIEAPYPRGEAFRTSEPYNAACRTVSARLREAMEAGV